jgi:DNA-binding NtrC family response regulator
MATVLALFDSVEDCAALEVFFRHTKWRLKTAGTLSAAAQLLDSNAIGVLLCGPTLRDGAAWRDLLELSRSHTAPPRLIVASAEADSNLWAEVLNEGGFDVLMKPFDQRELLHVVSLAWRHWWEDHGRQKKSPASAIQDEVALIAKPAKVSAA